VVVGLHRNRGSKLRRRLKEAKEYYNIFAVTTPGFEFLKKVETAISCLLSFITIEEVSYFTTPKLEKSKRVLQDVSK
jgi:hypothetical protein